VILGIETSCDETAAAIARADGAVLAEVVRSQVDTHARYGGVVPELASRRHIETIDQVVREALTRAGMSPRELSAVAVTGGPGLIGALLVGVAYGKALAYALKIPVFPVNHLEGHLSAASLGAGAVAPPFVALIASGGHTNLYHVTSGGEPELLGRTLDDAAGEAFDKAAKMLGLGYPGGPVIDRLAGEGDPERAPFPRPYPTVASRPRCCITCGIGKPMGVPGMSLTWRRGFSRPSWTSWWRKRWPPPGAAACAMSW